MRKFRFMLLLVFTLVLALPLGACTTSKQTPVPSSTPAPAPTPTPSTPSTTSHLTVGQLAEQGKIVLATKGSCHGESGQGLRAPAIIGADAHLEKYNNAKQLLDYINKTMPANAPGSLSQQEYLQVLCYILLQNNYATPNTTVDPNHLDVIVLTK